MAAQRVLGSESAWGFGDGELWSPWVLMVKLPLWLLVWWPQQSRIRLLKLSTCYQSASSTSGRRLSVALGTVPDLVGHPRPARSPMQPFVAQAAGGRLAVERVHEAACERGTRTSQKLAHLPRTACWPFVGCGACLVPVHGGQARAGVRQFRQRASRLSRSAP